MVSTVIKRVNYGVIESIRLVGINLRTDVREAVYWNFVQNLKKKLMNNLKGN